MKFSEISLAHEIDFSVFLTCFNIVDLVYLHDIKLLTAGTDTNVTCCWNNCFIGYHVS